MKVVYANDHGGICNNIKCYLSASRIALAEGAEVWTNSKILNLVFSDIKFTEKFNKENKIINDWRLMVLDEDNIPEGFTKSKDSMLFPGIDLLKRNIDFEYERIPKEIRKTYLQLLKKMKIKNDLLQIVESFSEKYFDNNIISVHMRTWLSDDWQIASRRHKHFFSYEKFIAAIKQIDSNSNIFLSCDNKIYTKKMKMEFNSRIIVFDEFKAIDLSPQERAFINLLLLAKNKSLIGSRASTFSEMAWWYSDCTSNVNII